MIQFVKLYLLSAGLFLIIDLFWLVVVSRKMYQHFIGQLLGETRLLPAILFYLLYVAGVTFFVLLPGVEKESLAYIIGAGALFGLVSYATYDLTNLATLKDWPVVMTVIDLAWGIFVTATTSGIVYWVNQHFF
ncbi:MAG: DUF2177 family protein [Enterococcus sp.]